MPTPFGVVYSTNITPDDEYGIGRYDFEDFDKSMREGIARDGHHLYPAMPYTSYAKVSEADMRALYAYFTQAVKSARVPNRESELYWPFSIRSLMSLWNYLYLEKGEYREDAGRSAVWNRGAYLVQGLGHCGACHTPRGIAGQEKDLSESGGRHYLSGTVIDNWFAPDLTNIFGNELHTWTEQEIITYLKTGRTARKAAFGSMSEVVGTSTQYLSDGDLAAIAEYLKSLKSSSEMPEAPQSDTEYAATRLIQSGRVDSRGARLYIDNCNACHRSDGAGVEHTFPSLVNNAAVNNRDPTSLIHIVLAGSAMPSTETAPSALAMPDFGWRLNDQDVADLLSFIRSNWGNRAPGVSANEVARLRKEILPR